MRRRALVCVAFLAACATTPAVAPAPEAALDGFARLPQDVVPESYALDLRVDPSADHLSGSVEIGVEVRRPTRRIVLHGDGLTIRDASVFCDVREGMRIPA